MVKRKRAIIQFESDVKLINEAINSINKGHTASYTQNREDHRQFQSQLEELSHQVNLLNWRITPPEVIKKCGANFISISCEREYESLAVSYFHMYDDVAVYAGHVWRQINQSDVYRLDRNDS